MNEHGKQLAEEIGEGTNVHLIGLELLTDRLNELLEKLWLQLNVPEGTQFDCVGLAISGAQDGMEVLIKEHLQVVVLLLTFYLLFVGRLWRAF